jgi:hypothetical protein
MPAKSNLIVKDRPYDTRKNRVWDWSKNGKSFIRQMSQYVGSLESQPGLDPESKKEVMLFKIIRFLGDSMSRAMPVEVSDYMVAHGFDEEMFFWLEKNVSKRKKAKSNLRVKSSLAPISLKVLGRAIGDEDEAYDPDAINGDPGKDNTVQDGTPWERPATPGVPAMRPAPRRSAVMRNARKVRTRSTPVPAEPIVAKPEEREPISLADSLEKEYDKLTKKFEESGSAADLESLRELARTIKTHIYNNGNKNKVFLQKKWVDKNPEPQRLRQKRASFEGPEWDKINAERDRLKARADELKKLDPYIKTRGGQRPGGKTKYQREYELQVEPAIYENNKLYGAERNRIDAINADIRDQNKKRFDEWIAQRDKAVAEQMPNISADQEVMLMDFVNEIYAKVAKGREYDGPSRDESVSANGELRPARQGLMPRTSVVKGADRVLGLRSPEGFHLPVEIPVVDGGMDLEGAVQHLADGGALSEVPDDFLVEAIFSNVLMQNDLQAGIDRADQIIKYDPVDLTDFKWPPPDDLHPFLAALERAERVSNSEIAGRFIPLSRGAGVNGVVMYYDRVSQQRVGIKYAFGTSVFPDEDINEMLGAHIAERLGFAYGSMRWGGAPPVGGFPTQAVQPRTVRPMVFELLHNYANRSGDPADGLSLDIAIGSGYPMQASADSLVSGLLLDLIIQNRDRHYGNYFVGENPDGDMAWFVPIDHGISNMDERESIADPVNGLTGGLMQDNRNMVGRIQQILTHDKNGIADTLSKADLLVAIRAAQASLREADSALEINEAIGRILNAARNEVEDDMRKVTGGLASRLKEVTDIDPDDLLKLFEAEPVFWTPPVRAAR